MGTIQYILAKVLKKIRGSAIKNSTIGKGSKVESGSSIVDVTMDKYSFCGYNCEIYNAHIGSFTSIANGVIIGGGAHPMEWVGMSPVFYEGRDSVTKKFSEFKRTPSKITNIGHDVWIGQNVIIRQGVTVGTGAVIGMGAIITKDVPAYAVVAGNPGKLLKYRFNDDLISQLLDSEWWSLDETQLKKVAQYIRNPELFLESLKNIK
jgi:acetyltransferase-like isoleucine patch superfamily enzyme